MKLEFILALVITSQVVLSNTNEASYNSNMGIFNIYSTSLISDQYPYENQNGQGNGFCNNGQANGFGNGFGNNGNGDGNGNGNGNGNSCLDSSSLSDTSPDSMKTGDILSTTSPVIQSPFIDTAGGTSTSIPMSTWSIDAQVSSGRQVLPGFLIISFCLSLIGLN